MARYGSNSEAFFAGAGGGLAEGLPAAVQMLIKSKEGDKDFARQQAATMALHKMIADQAEQSRLATQQGQSWDRTVQQGYDTGTNSAGESAVLNQLGPQGAAQLSQEGHTAMPLNDHGGGGVPLSPDAIDTLKVLQRQSKNPSNVKVPRAGGSGKDKYIQDLKSSIATYRSKNFLGESAALTPEAKKAIYNGMVANGHAGGPQLIHDIEASSILNQPTAQ